MPSSQRCLRGSRKFFGGAPAGVAAMEAEVEKDAALLEEKVVRVERKALISLEHGRIEDSAVIYLLDAIFHNSGRKVVALNLVIREVMQPKISGIYTAHDWLGERTMIYNLFVSTSKFRSAKLSFITISEYTKAHSYGVSERISSLAMIRTTLLSSVRCASTLALRVQQPVVRKVAPGFFVKPALLTPSLKFQSHRWYSAPASLTKEEVEGRIIGILQNFDKVRLIPIELKSHNTNIWTFQVNDTTKV